MASLRWKFLGRAAYEPVWQLQESLRERILAGDDSAETLLFVEHDPVITMGRSANPANVLSAEVPVVRTSRGGDVTVHGPGQLVIYPVVRLPRGVVAFVEAIGGAIADELGARGVAARFGRDPVGVWVGPREAPRKVAACGLHLRRRVAVHGFAVNIADACLPLFDLIVPCGLRGVAVTSLERELGAPAPELSALVKPLALRIARALDRAPEHAREQILC